MWIDRRSTAPWQPDKIPRWAVNQCAGRSTPSANRRNRLGRIIFSTKQSLPYHQRLYHSAQFGPSRRSYGSRLRHWTLARFWRVCKTWSMVGPYLLYTVRSVSCQSPYAAYLGTCIVYSSWQNNSFVWCAVNYKPYDHCGLSLTAALDLTS